MTTKTKILSLLAAVCVVLSPSFWLKEPDAYSSATIEAAEEVSRAETEMLAPDDAFTARREKCACKAI